jgi:hypothetical protein
LHYLIYWNLAPTAMKAGLQRRRARANRERLISLDHGPAMHACATMKSAINANVIFPSHAIGRPPTTAPPPCMTVPQNPEPIPAIGIMQQSTADER